jgi:hypothetical protein
MLSFGLFYLLLNSLFINTYQSSGLRVHVSIKKIIDGSGKTSEFHGILVKLEESDNYYIWLCSKKSS